MLATTIREEKEIKRIQIGKEEVKLSLFAGDMIVYRENPKDSTRKLLELINESIVKLQDIKLTHRNPLHSYTLTINNEKTEREIKETIPSTTAKKRIKYLGINLTKETQELYIEHYTTPMKENIDDTNRWRNIPCSWNQYSENEYTTQSNL